VTVFRGCYEHTVDDKGRTSLPRRFREDLLNAFSDDRLVVARSLEPCLMAYPVSEWEAFEQRVAAKGQFNRAVLQLKRAVVASAVECKVDSHGRILLPQVLRDYAGITHEVVWAGMTQSIEIWAKDRWEEAERRARENPEALGESLAELGL
jgi:MraZ protein